jgi:hypothetical protein
MPKVKNLVGTSGLRTKNLPKKNVATANVNGSIKDISVGKEDLIELQLNMITTCAKAVEPA